MPTIHLKAILKQLQSHLHVMCVPRPRSDQLDRSSDRLIVGSSHLIIAVNCGFGFRSRRCVVVVVAKRSNVIKLSTSLACQWQQQLTTTANNNNDNELQIAFGLLLALVNGQLGDWQNGRIGKWEWGNGRIGEWKWDGNGNEAHAQPAAAY